MEAEPSCSGWHRGAVGLLVPSKGQVAQPGSCDVVGCLQPPQHSRQSSGSSERSPQSSSVSHFHQKGMHLSFLQTNCKRGTSL